MVMMELYEMNYLLFMAGGGGTPTAADSLLHSMGEGCYRTMSTAKTELHCIVREVSAPFAPQTGISNSFPKRY